MRQYVESARVYLKPNGTASLLIKCCLCSTSTFSGSQWEEFVRHLQSQHSNARKLNDDELQDEVQLEMENLRGSHLKGDSLGHTHTRYSNSPQNNDDEIKDEVRLEMENLKKARCFLDEEDGFDQVEDPENAIEEQEQEPVPDPEESHYIVDQPNKPFYSLLHTSSRIIFHFIELLRQHKHLFSAQRRTQRKERRESGQRMADSLNRRFGLQLQEPVVSASARHLQQWFERQYVLQLSNSEFRSRHPEYYRKLMQFMPTAHISVTICEVCDRRFLNEHRLRLHKFRMHRGPNPNVCSLCHASFQNDSKLRQHEARYHFKLLEWQCQLCDYNAPSKWDFKQHQIMHGGQRNYTCELCGHSSKTSSSLAVHRRTHDKPRLSCSQCNRKFRENYILKCHIRKVHGSAGTRKRMRRGDARKAKENIRSLEESTDIDDPDNTEAPEPEEEDF